MAYVVLTVRIVDMHSKFKYGWNHSDLTRTSIQISQLVEGVRHCKLVFSKAMSRVHCLKHRNSKNIPYFFNSTPQFLKTSIQISDEEIVFMKKFSWKIFFVRFLIMKKTYKIWSHELTEKLDFWLFAIPNDDFSVNSYVILILGSWSKNYF